MMLNRSHATLHKSYCFIEVLLPYRSHACLQKICFSLAKFFQTEPIRVYMSTKLFMLKALNSFIMTVLFLHIMQDEYIN